MPCVAIAVAVKEWETRREQGGADAASSEEEEEEENIYVTAGVDVRPHQSVCCDSFILPDRYDLRA